ncbi:MAG: hypothetical protein AB7F94_17525 [Nitrospira sp.]
MRSDLVIQLGGKPTSWSADYSESGIGVVLVVLRLDSKRQASI